MSHMPAGYCSQPIIAVSSKVQPATRNLQPKKIPFHFHKSRGDRIFASAKTEFMLIIEIKDSENIDRALKRYKRKVQQTKILRELRDRKEFTKPSVQRRNQILKAVYKEKKSRDLGE